MIRNGSDPIKSAGPSRPISISTVRHAVRQPMLDEVKLEAPRACGAYAAADAGRRRRTQNADGVAGKHAKFKGKGERWFG